MHDRGAKDNASKPPTRVSRATSLIVPGLKFKGETIAGRYRIESLLGVGSSGVVVAARHVYLRRKVTLKILTASTAAHQRAQRRCLATVHRAAELSSPHVARVIDTGFTEDGLPFIVTERLEGRSLAEELEARGRLPPAEAVHWILHACEGLAEAHALGIVHGNVKPQNLFLCGSPTLEGDGDPRVLKVLDFGMAPPLMIDDDKGAAAWFASPAYLAPEQIQDPEGVDARAEIWALGVILHQIIAGSLPFTADTIAGMLVAVAHDEPAMLTAEDVPFELARIVQSCLAKDRDARPENLSVLAKSLAQFAGSHGNVLASRVDAALFRRTRTSRPAADSSVQRTTSDSSRTDKPSDAHARPAARSKAHARSDDARRARPRAHRSRGLLAIVAAVAGVVGASGFILASSFTPSEPGERPPLQPTTLKLPPSQRASLAVPEVVPRERVVPLVREESLAAPLFETPTSSPTVAAPASPHASQDAHDAEHDERRPQRRLQTLKVTPQAPGFTHPSRLLEPKK